MRPRVALSVESPLHPSSGMTPPLTAAGTISRRRHHADARRIARNPVQSLGRSPLPVASSGPSSWPAGSGVRLRPLTRVICGDDRPKQYVALTGSRSLLQQTLDRAGRRIPADRTVVVSLEAQASQLAAALSGHDATVLLQSTRSRNRGGRAPPGALDPSAGPRRHGGRVPVGPPRHGGRRFMDQVVAAAAYVDENPGRIVLLGAQPTEPEPEYGWIEPGPVLARIGGDPDPGGAPVHREAVPGDGTRMPRGGSRLEHLRVRGEGERPRGRGAAMRASDPLRARAADPRRRPGRAPRRPAADLVRACPGATSRGTFSRT